MKTIYWNLFFVLALFACNPSNTQTTQAEERIMSTEPKPVYSASKTPSLEEAQLVESLADYEQAIFASGCFWCTEEVYERVVGVHAVYSGYIGGNDPNPTYREVSSGITDYAEAVIVYYDPEVISYDLLLEFFYASHDPTQINRQGPDVGPQYRSGVFYLDDEQKNKAVAYQEKLNNSGKYSSKIATEITAASTFYLAEEYHQNYYPAHPDNPYIQRVSRPKVEKFAKAYAQYLEKA
ncbi:MAG: peptide-methionine (S)-S-oxide reductase MsrA [Bacteroidota bacterium]